MAGQLIDANGGVSMLRPGQTIALPVVSGSEAANPNFNPKTWDEVVKFTLAQEALRKAEEKPAGPPSTPQLPEGLAGLELALRMLANGTLTPAAFHALFPHVDLANAIYAANTGQLTAGTVEWLWRENVYSQAALQQKQEDMAALRKALIDLQARDITDAELLAMFPHLPIDQALGMLNNPEGLYNLWMTHAGKAWVQGVENRRAAEARQASYEAWREGELADAAIQPTSPPINWPLDFIDFLRDFPISGNLPAFETRHLPYFRLPTNSEVGQYAELSYTPFGNPANSITDPEVTFVSHLAPFEYVVRVLDDKTPEFGVGVNLDSLPRSTLYFSFESLGSFGNATLEIKGIVEKDIPLDPTIGTVSSSTGYYVRIEQIWPKAVAATVLIGAGILLASLSVPAAVVVGAAIGIIAVAAAGFEFFLNGGNDT
ncbi:MAG TPA: hypothetical protein PLC52_01105 [Anaerolineales bacterium]|nr:hypothetical protein [Anaerolineales bacterium]HRQ91449.1 hypothetical protein [Anaerolineales bacterium]